MATDILNNLDELKPEFKNRLPKNVLVMFNSHLQSRGINPSQLVDPVQIANANWSHKPKYGVDGLKLARNRHSEQKVATLEAGHETNFTFILNTALSGGNSYPVLTAVLGTAAGFASTPVGLFFTVASTAMDVSKTAQRILGRMGDEIWQVEEIGKIRDNKGFKAVHINSYWLSDPYRSKHSAKNKGWLIHEERNDLILS